MDFSLSAAALRLQSNLSQAAASGELGRVAAESFGLLSVPESFWELQQAWAAGQFSDFPAITLVPGSAMAGARGAYVADTGSILINQNWLSTAAEPELLAVLAEEVGHHLDARFNSADTPGDEGELFSRLLLGQRPSASERVRIANDSDAIQVSLANGRLAWAEAADALDPVVRLTGSAQADQLSGGSNNDALFGMAGADELLGAAGNDYLDGGDGTDLMTGGLGDDTYIVDSSADLVNEVANEGKDSILSSVSLTLPDHVENLDLRTTAEATGTGNSLDNVIYGGFAASHLSGGGGHDSLYGRGVNADHLEGGLGNDFLDGGQGIDLMAGGEGDDTYVVRDSGDQVVESGQAGLDWVYATTSYDLGSNVENLQLFGSGDGLQARGNSANNTLIGDNWTNQLSGLAGDDYLNGGAGADHMVGGSGNDTYIVDNANDTVLEQSGEGSDWVVSSISQTLASNVEHLDLRGSADLTGTGNGENNIIKGNLGNSTLDGGAGNDSLYGRGGGSDVLLGGSGNDYLDGGLGADRMDGGTGNDTFVVDNAGDQVIEALDSGSDWVIADVSYTLGDNLEGLILRGGSGAANLDGTGNQRDNTLIGNGGRNSLFGGDGNDVLNGGRGADLLEGGNGRDVFVLSSREQDQSLALDQIADFQTGRDLLYLTRSTLNIDPSRLTAGVLGSTDFAVVTSATQGGLEGSSGLGSAALFVLDQSMGILYYNANGTEQGAGEFSAGIMQVLSGELKASDILIA